MSTILDTPEERHAFVLGFFEVVPPWHPRVSIHTYIEKDIQGEEHYYQAGRGLGFIVLFCLVCLAVKWLT